MADGANAVEKVEFGVAGGGFAEEAIEAIGVAGGDAAGAAFLDRLKDRTVGVDDELAENTVERLADPVTEAVVGVADGIGRGLDSCEEVALVVGVERGAIRGDLLLAISGGIVGVAADFRAGLVGDEEEAVFASVVVGPEFLEHAADLDFFGLTISRVGVSVGDNFRIGIGARAGGVGDFPQPVQSIVFVVLLLGAGR